MSSFSETFSSIVAEKPAGHTQFLTGLDFALNPVKEIVVAGDLNWDHTQEMLKNIRSYFLPNSVIIFHPDGPNRDNIENIAPFVKELEPIDNKTAVYVCKNYTCNLPVTRIKDLKRVLKK